MGNKTNTKVFFGFLWSFGERILAQGVSFIVSVVLARLLLPAEYGIVGIVLAFINIANVFVSQGFGESLIQKKEATTEDFSTIFWCSQGVAWGLFILLFYFAPIISLVYNDPQLIMVIRVLSIKLPIASINTIQHAYVSKHMQFKKFFWSTLSGTIISGIVGVIMAYHGFGVWALVAQYLTNSITDTIFLFFTVEWKPAIKFSKKSAHELFGFSLQMMIAGFISTVYSEMQTLTIGTKYTTSDLAYYNRGAQFPSLFITNINSAVGKVLFPAMSNTDGKVEIRNMTRRSMQITAYIITPIMFGLIGISEPLVRVLLTDKWLPCVAFVRLLCLAYVLQPIQTANCQAIKAMGRSDIYLKMEIVKKLIGISLLLLSLNHGVRAIAIAFVISVFISTIISCFPNRKLLDYSYKDQIKDLLPSFVISIVMLIAVMPIMMLPIQPIFILMLQTVLGVLIYILLSKLTKNESYSYLITFAYGFKKKRN